MDTVTLQSYAIGILVAASMYVACHLALGKLKRSLRRAVGVASGASGLLMTLYLRERPALLAEYGGQIVAALIALVLALLIFLRRALQR